MSKPSAVNLPPPNFSPASTNHSECIEASNSPKRTTVYDDRDISERERRNNHFRPRSDLQLVKSILGKALARRGLDKKVERYRFMTHWPDIVGEGLVGVCKPDCFSKNTLIVKVVNSGWAQELTFLKPMIMQNVAKYMPPGQRIDDIVFRVGSI